eukprot:TRINITY_DN1522_c0_g1_i1.p1 TRINITY_DN1522_c0_g1~~TRINITY_DN1522_c0_g1_i1.p1  ORF type:complete len:292 (+),score=48.35 TRINITY_DN1522_c0_g1_i1:164-1039(+)
MPSVASPSPMRRPAASPSPCSAFKRTAAAARISPWRTAPAPKAPRWVNGIAVSPGSGRVRAQTPVSVSSSRSSSSSQRSLGLRESPALTPSSTPSSVRRVTARLRKTSISLSRPSTGSSSSSSTTATSAKSSPSPVKKQKTKSSPSPKGRPSPVKKKTKSSPAKKTKSSPSPVKKTKSPSPVKKTKSPAAPVKKTKSTKRKLATRDRRAPASDDSQATLHLPRSKKLRRGNATIFVTRADDDSSSEESDLRPDRKCLFCGVSETAHGTKMIFENRGAPDNWICYECFVGAN